MIWEWNGPNQPANFALVDKPPEQLLVGIGAAAPAPHRTKLRDGLATAGDKQRLALADAPQVFGETTLEIADSDDHQANIVM